MVGFDEFGTQLDELMEEIRDAIIQVTAAKNAESRMLRKAAVDNFSKTQRKIQKFVQCWS